MEEKECVETGACSLEITAQNNKLGFLLLLFLSLFPGFDSNFGPLTLTVSFCKGVVARCCQSDLALGYNAEDPKRGSGASRTPAT